MFAALGLHSSPMAKGDQLCHARNISRVLCPQMKSLSAEDDALEGEEVFSGGQGSALEDRGIQISKRLIQVAVKRDTNGSLGLTLCGGACNDNPSFSRPLIVSQVRPNSPVHREGSIRPGDRLLAVDGHSTEHVTLGEAQSLLLHNGHCMCRDREDPECRGGSMSEECCTLLVIEYDVIVRQRLSEPQGPFLVELQMDHPGEELGLSLTMLPEEEGEGVPSRPAALVEAVRPASIAERCGALHPGDVLLSIGEACPSSSSSRKGGAVTPWVLHMEVLPLSLMDRPATTSSRCSDLSSCGRKEGIHFMAGRSQSSQDVERGGSEHQQHCDVVSTGSSSSSLVWNVESHCEEGWGQPPTALPVRLKSAQRGAEILQLEEFLQASESRTLEQGEQDGPSWQLGSFQSFGGEAFLGPANEGMTHVGECCVDGSGDAPVLQRPQPICWIGSHDSPPMSDRLEEEDDGDDCLASKDSASSGEFPLFPFIDDKEMEVYIVEVPRGGGPLGITLSGTEDPLEYVTISGLVEGGPAHRTAALAVGDRLLAVGGESLVGRPLSEAVSLLRAASDPVILYMARPLPSQCSPSALSRALITDTAPASPVGGKGPFLDLLSGSVGSKAPSLSACGGVEEEEAREVDSSVAIHTFHPSKLPLSQHLNQGSSSHLTNVLNRPVSFDSDEQCSLSHSIGGSLPGGCRSDLKQSPKTDTLRLTLFKDGIYEDFGFSVSDGLYERGVYVNRIRKGGPADIGSLLPYDRIIQVNDTMTYAFDCCLTVPLIASAGDKIDLTIVRSL